MNCILMSLRETEFLEFANSFIQGTHYEKEMYEFKVKVGYEAPPGQEGRANLGKSYYKGFMKHHRKFSRVEEAT